MFCADSRPCANTRFVSYAVYVAYKTTHYDVALHFIEEITSHLSPKNLVVSTNEFSLFLVMYGAASTLKTREIFKK